ncbi:hypothetical protein Lalb_Chr04g0263771 [Lupinus albus]|uniref:Secreted protein n=1 Tax=Lupinus albus TaxID=3870 RepID=A0A6A4QRU0_LUPAL|nr:hypothetical protein Lalb_Chr04g0263771 [Lupinus albus]
MFLSPVALISAAAMASASLWFTGLSPTDVMTASRASPIVIGSPSMAAEPKSVATMGAS